MLASDFLKACHPPSNHHFAVMPRFTVADLLFEVPRPRSRQERIARIDALARLVDVAFLIPATQIRFGLDAQIGLIPGGPA